MSKPEKATPAAAPVTKPQQLKKQDFLNVVLDTPMTREQLIDALSEFTFIGTYVDYLTDHFIAQGKIIRNEDGTIQRKGKKPSASHEVHRVVLEDVYDEDGELTGEGQYALESKTLAPGEKLDKEAGWAVTKNAAVKRMKSQIFADYKAATEAVGALLIEEEAGDE